VVFYWVEIQDEIITGYGTIEGNVSVDELELDECQRIIPEHIALQLTSLPAYFETDDDDNIVSVMPIERPPGIEYDEVDPEKIAMAEAIIQHEMEIQQLKAELATLKGEE